MDLILHRGGRKVEAWVAETVSVVELAPAGLHTRRGGCLAGTWLVHGELEMVARDRLRHQYASRGLSQGFTNTETLHDQYSDDDDDEDGSS